ncbi:serine/arginine repetitive matrix protein 2-like isoform X2 [Biomphalaria glabrata]|uniref:Serine/arginine repetitive matrix protein 2-like isoform X2 n=1 Tax=Biomphalaria glabrata TaxID=6526 RepID=A0A9U8E698_BIOGL|nr:serine/arginine repetitive matrix protein 2-like isoform X2 [Biomphalaria glabrata]
MASDSPGGYNHISHYVIDGQMLGGVGVGSGQHRDCKDSGYYVSTSDGASTCSSSATEAGDFEGGTLLVLEPKSLRSFTTNDEYLYAMKEDLADWFSCLYQTVITAENFMSMLETGVLLCKHANKMQEYARERQEKGETLEMRSYFIRSIPLGNVPFKEGVKPETFQARDNVSNFIKWGRQMGIPEVLSFETDDLVLRKNEKSVILCLLEMARVGAKLGMLAPTLVQMEEEIDAELAGDEPPLPRPQIQTCDMRSLDERVRDLIRRCTCPVQFPMVKVGEGKYKIGDSRSLIFVRILRNHVMVRVGGGWDTLENYLNKHDPCQCHYRGHRPTVSANQQRRPSNTGYSVTRPAPNTPTSPRRNIQTTAASAANTNATLRERSASPQLTATRNKSPTLIISRHVVQGDSRASKFTARVSHVADHPHNSYNNNYTTPRCGSPNTTAATRMRTPSPVGPSSSFQGNGKSSSGVLSSADLTSRTRHHSSSMSRSISLDDHTEMNSVSRTHLSTLDHVSESGSTSSLDKSGHTNVTMDKISTMTLSEFKSLLSSSFAVPDHANSRGEPSQGPNLETLRDKARSIRDSMSSKANTRRSSSSQSRSSVSQEENNVHLPGTDRPKTPQASRRNLSSAISRPKTPTSLGSHRPQTPTEKIGQKDEYTISRPKTPSQIKRDAVAKVAGAISNWVESRSEIDSRPKTPTRHKSPLAARSEQYDSDEDESSLASSLSKSQSHSLASTVKERPCTPSRIPKPCFASRPNTPKSVMSDSNLEESFSSHGRPNTISLSRSQLLSRSSSNASSIRSEDGPPSPSGSQGDEKSMRLSRPTTVISRKQQTPTKAGASYKDLYNTRRAITPGPTLSGQAVTPGPREKWSLGSNGDIDIVDARRRGSLDVSLTNKSKSHQNVSYPQDAYGELPVTNEITFSDDEEINELVKNAALMAMASSKKKIRSSSVDARKLARKSAKDKQEEILMIRRDSSGSHGVQIVQSDGVKYDSSSKSHVVKRPPSADSVHRTRAMTPDSSTYHQKSTKAKATNPESGDKSQNRTEAWVDTTLSDPKRKQPPHPKRPKGIVNDIPASELEPRPLEEIQAILQEPKNGFVQVNTEALSAPPEDPELYRKMEKLFEKYREMELRASVNDTPGGNKMDKTSDASLNHSGNKAPKSTPSVASGKTSSGSVSSSGMSSGIANGTSSVKSSEDNRFKRSSSVPISFQNAAMTVSSYDEKKSNVLVTSEEDFQNSLKDIDAEIAKNPTALVSKIKEILKVRPRKDENSEIPTRIPGPSSLSRSSRSKSVTNLYNNRLSSCDEDDREEAISPSAKIKSDGKATSGNIAYTEFMYQNSQEEVPELSRTWSCRSDSSDGQSRVETPAPRLATPLTTGRSTLILKKPEKLGRSPSHEKDSNSHTNISRGHVFSTGEEDADFV